ncbi:MAG: hypothetical protein IPO58_20655 [Betaproteobacteria bacterium]|nr:hypothetical protein [Betaproteobacteria bacterium]
MRGATRSVTIVSVNTQPGVRRAGPCRDETNCPPDPADSAMESGFCAAATRFPLN